MPAQHGGGSVSGNGAVDAALIAYVRGRALQPGPFVGTNVAAYALAAAGSEQQRERVLPALLSGAAAAAWVVTTSPGVQALDAAVSARPDGDGFRLNGQGTVVQDPGPGGWLLVTAASQAGPAQFLLPAATAASARCPATRSTSAGGSPT